MNQLCYLIDCYWLLENIFMMLACDDDDVISQWVSDHPDDESMFWFNLSEVRELELNLDSFGCLDANL